MKFFFAQDSYTKQWDTDHNGFRTTIRNAASDKIKQQAPVIVDSKAAQVKPTLVSVQHDAENIKPIEPKRAANDMSAIANFKEAFRTARQGGHKTFFWKKTKANPSGMFSTDYAEQGNQGSKQSASPKQGIDQLMFKAAETLPQQQSALEKQLMQPVSYPFAMDDIARDSKILAIKNIIPNPKGNPGMYVNGNTNKYAAGGNIQGQSGLVDTIIDALNSSADIQTINNIIQKSGQNPETIIKEIVARAQGGDQAAAMAFSNLEKLMKNSTVAKLGTKLNYIQKLKGICPEGTEKIYLKNGGCMCSQKAQKGGKAKMPTEYNEKRHERLAIGEAMGKNNKAQQDSLQTYRNLYNKKSASDKYKMGDQDPHGKNPKKKVQEKGCGGKTLVSGKKK